MISVKVCETCFDGYHGGSKPKKRPRRCTGCEAWRVKVGTGDFVCRHMNPNHKEPSRMYKRCRDCRSWAEHKGVTKDFWCKHYKWKFSAYKLNGKWP